MHSLYILSKLLFASICRKNLSSLVRPFLELYLFLMLLSASFCIS